MLKHSKIKANLKNLKYINGIWISLNVTCLLLVTHNVWWNMPVTGVGWAASCNWGDTQNTHWKRLNGRNRRWAQTWLENMIMINELGKADLTKDPKNIQQKWEGQLLANTVGKLCCSCYFPFLYFIFMFNKMSNSSVYYFLLKVLFTQGHTNLEPEKVFTKA